ncbi:hypothetical protein BH20BAC1_BH20BAC1_24410 [soil metagenome]
MKHLLTAAILLAFSYQQNTLFAQTDKNKPKNDKSVENNSQNNNKPSRTVTTMDYESRVYNECVPEFVNLKGTVTYSVKEVRNDKRYFIIYKIDLKKVTGVGEKTGQVYKGGGVIMNKVNANFEAQHTVGNDHYQVKYRSPGYNLIYTQKAHFVLANGEERVSFNDASDKCVPAKKS